jgi:ParB family chromosome partitioning protein
MTTKKKGLGRGLGALIPSAATAPLSPPEGEAGLLELPVAQIVPNPRQPRQVLDPEKLEALAASIAEHGLIQPLIVTELPTGGYQLIAGERRWRAGQLAGLSTMPAIVKESTPQQMLELALVENLQRADLNPLEEAEAYTQLMAEFGLTQEVVAERVGKSRTAIANTVRLLQLPGAVKAALAGEEISEGHARALLGLKTEHDQLGALATITHLALNVRQTEALIRKLLTGDETSKPKRAPLTPLDKSVVDRFEKRLGTRVELSRTDAEGGKITIHFYSQEELQAIFAAIAGEEERL